MTNRKQMTIVEIQPGCYIVGSPEWVEGAERLLVPTTRSEKGPGDAEQRSAEGRAVPPDSDADLPTPAPLREASEE